MRLAMRVGFLRADPQLHFLQGLPLSLVRNCAWAAVVREGSAGPSR